MSLLMEALKKAENARQRQEHGAPPAKEAPVPVSTQTPAVFDFPEIGLLQDEEERRSGKVEPVFDPSIKIESIGLVQEMEPALFEDPAAREAPGVTVDAIGASPIAAGPLASPAAAASDGLAILEQPYQPEPEPQLEARAPEAAMGLAEVRPAPEKSYADPFVSPVSPSNKGGGADDPSEASQRRAQQMARTVFEAKDRGGNRRSKVIAGIGLGVSLLAAAGAWFGWQMMNTPGGIAGPLLTSAPAPSPEMAVANAAETPSPFPVVPPQGEARQAAAAAPGAEAAASPAPAVPPAAPPAAPAAGVASQAAPVSAPAGYSVEASGINIRRGGASRDFERNLQQAYKAYQEGDLSGAEQLYRRALRDDPFGRDALLGLAAIAQQREQPEQAASLYARLLQADPADPDANAGIAGLQRDSPGNQESRLKKSLAQHPQAAALHFELGNLYIRQSRWADAQQAYFEAHSASPANADYAFNLAVSLDRLGQPKLALEHYRKALKLAANTQAAFGPEVVQTRIAELEAAAR